MTVGKFLFTYRRFLPVPFFVAAIVWANPQKDLVIFGGLLMASGEILRLAAVSFTGPAVRRSEIVTQELITNGPFAFLRNPIYLGNLLLYMGASILSAAWLPYLLYLTFIFFSVHYAICIRYEEAQLHQAFGSDYLAYMNNVPRLFPRLSAYPARGKKKASITEAFHSESSTLLIIALFLLLVAARWYFFT